MRISILSPFFAPSVGGAAKYYSILVDLLKEDFKQIELITESHPQKKYGNELIPEKNLLIRRLIPYKSGRSSKDIIRYLSFAVQELLIILLPFIISKKSKALVIHSNFIQNSFALPMMLSISKSLFKRIKLIADIRDNGLCASKIDLLNEFNEVIVCSKNALANIKNRQNNLKITYIPVPFILEKIDSSDASNVLKKLKVDQGEYIFTPNGIDEKKTFSKIYELFKLLKLKMPKLKLVVAGRYKSKKSTYNESIRNGEMIHFNELDSKKILSLMMFSKLILVMPNPIDGMPRTILEGISVGARIMYPYNIYELEGEEDITKIYKNTTTKEIADNAEKIITNDIKIKNYDLSINFPKNLKNDYLKTLRNECI